MKTRLDFWHRFNEYDGKILPLSLRPGSDELRRRIASLIKPEDTVADIGCGYGHFLPDLAAARRIYAVDASQTNLDEAQKNAPDHTTFLARPLEALALPEKVDLALCFNTLMPGNHTQALTMLDRLISAVKPGGTLLLVAPSMESRLYTCNMAHFEAARRGEEKASLVVRMNEFVESFNNPLGYVREPGGQVMKYWLADEMRETLRRNGRVGTIELFKVPVHWTDYTEKEKWQEAIEPPWFWGWQIEISGQGPD